MIFHLLYSFYSAKNLCKLLRTPKGRRVLKKYQVRSNSAVNEMKIDVRTRWNSTLEMLARVLEQRNALMLLLGHSTDDDEDNVDDENSDLLYIPPEVILNIVI